MFALSVATAPRPYRLTAASLGDHGTGGADLLVAASAGSLDLQVIETWSTANHVVPAASISL